MNSKLERLLKTTTQKYVTKQPKFIAKNINLKNTESAFINIKYRKEVWSALYKLENVLYVLKCNCYAYFSQLIVPQHEISNNVECATSKASDHPAQMRSLIRAFAGRLSIV